MYLCVRCVSPVCVNTIFTHVSSYVFMSIYSDHLKSVCLSLQAYHGKDCGFFIFDQGKGYLELNDIFVNHIAGVEIKNKVDPFL